MDGLLIEVNFILVLDNRLYMNHFERFVSVPVYYFKHKVTFKEHVDVNSAEIRSVSYCIQL